MSRHTRLKTLSIKVPASLSARVLKLAKSRKSTVSQVVREAIELYAPKQGVSFADAAHEYIGSLDGGPGDLSTNPRHMKGFGR